VKKDQPLKEETHTGQVCSETADRSLAATGGHPEPPDALTIDVVFDAICPWSYIGKRRLEKALALLGQPARSSS
jgi:hypothetical protein